LPPFAATGAWKPARQGTVTLKLGPKGGWLGLHPRKRVL
jgi:hypothetical protein